MTPIVETARRIVPAAATFRRQTTNSRQPIRRHRKRCGRKRSSVRLRGPADARSSAKCRIQRKNGREKRSTQTSTGDQRLLRSSVYEIMESGSVCNRADPFHFETAATSVALNVRMFVPWQNVIFRAATICGFWEGEAPAEPNASTRCRLGRSRALPKRRAFVFGRAEREDGACKHSTLLR